MKLTITLTDQEIADISGWVNFYTANPQLVGIPNTAPAGQPVNGQTKIVLESQTKARFEEIAAQFQQPAMPVIVMPDCPATGVNQHGPEPIYPGEIYTTFALGNGKFSGSISSGQPILWYGVSTQSGVADGGWSPTPVAVKAGQYASLRIMDGYPSSASGCLYSIVPGPSF